MEEKSTTLNLITKLSLLIVKVLVVVFAVTGLVGMFKAVFKTIVFNEYPLQSWESTVPDIKTGQPVSRPAKDVEISRKLQMLEDYSSSVTMLLLAGGLTWLLKNQERKINA